MAAAIFSATLGFSATISSMFPAFVKGTNKK
jgi:hypothetical protein